MFLDSLEEFLDELDDFFIGGLLLEHISHVVGSNGQSLFLGVIWFIWLDWGEVLHTIKMGGEHTTDLFADFFIADDLAGHTGDLSELLLWDFAGQKLQGLINVDHLDKLGTFLLFEDEPVLAVVGTGNESIRIDLASDDVFSVAESDFKGNDEGFGAVDLAVLVNVAQTLVVLVPGVVECQGSTSSSGGWIDGE